MSETYFVTGAQGCIGAWVVKALAARGDRVVVFDLSADAGRLRALAAPAVLERVHTMVGDVTDQASVREALARSQARRVIHLAGLLTPACQADPQRGAAVNVGGTLNLFEAARALGVERVVYASSAAVFGLAEDGPGEVDETAPCRPTTLYGVFKRANEESARVYYHEYGLSSVGLRPLVVYGFGRDAGLSSDPTVALKEAVLGRPFQIRFGGATDFLYAADAAAAFIACADRAPAGAHLFNLHGETAEVEQFVREARRALPEGQRSLISWGGPPLPIPAVMKDAAIRATVGPLPATPLAQGIRETIQKYIELKERGMLEASASIRPGEAPERPTN